MSTLILIAILVYATSIVISQFDAFISYEIMDKNPDNEFSYLESLYETSHWFIKALLKPTMICNVCMSSFWGTFFYLLITDEITLVTWIFTMLFSAGFIGMINHLGR